MIGGDIEGMRKTRMVPGALPSCWKLTLLLCLLWHCCQAYINKCQRQGPQETLAGRTEPATTFQRYVFTRFLFRSFQILFLVTFGDEVTKIQKFYVIFVYILQGKIGKMEKKL